VTTQRLLDIFTLMERLGRESSNGIELCGVAAEFMSLDGAGIALVHDGGELSSLCTSNETAKALMELELTLGEGPTVDAGRGDAVAAANLIEAGASHWNLYRPEALALGVRAVFGYPVRLGAVHFGALNLFRCSPGPLDTDQATDAYLMASVIGRAILTYQAGGSADRLVGELNGSSMLDFRIHQAAGMLAVQGSMSVRDALVSLRAHAFGIGCPLSELADRVVTRSTRYAPETGKWLLEPENSRDPQ